MHNIIEICKEFGFEIPADKQADFNKKVAENYRTKEDYDKVVKKRDEYKDSLDDVQTKLDGFKDVNVDDLKNQIATLTKDLSDEKAARAKDAAKVEMEKNVTSFFASVDEKGEKKFNFLNDITENYYRDALMQELDKDSAKGKSINEIFTALITGEDGKQKPGIFVDKAETNKAKFTQPGGKTPPPGSKISPAELMRMKNENPNLDISQYM